MSFQHFRDMTMQCRQRNENAATLKSFIHHEYTPCGLRGCKNTPAAFPGRMSYKATKPGLVLFYIFACVILYCCLLGPLLCIVSFHCYVFCLLVVLVELSVFAKWLARKTPLRKPNRGEGIVSRKPRPKSVHDFLGLLYCFIVYYVSVLFPVPAWYIFLFLWRDIAYLCWKCR